jgi:hypothetical protein
MFFLGEYIKLLLIKVFIRRMLYVQMIMGLKYEFKSLNPTRENLIEMPSFIY